MKIHVILIGKDKAIEYYLTEEGKTLVPVIEAIAKWEGKKRRPRDR